MPTTGRPSKLIAKIRVPVGRDDTVTVTIAEAIHRRIRERGCTVGLAAKAYGLGADTAWGWIKEGRKQIVRRDEGRQMSQHELRLCQFVEGCDRAHAQYIADQDELMDKLANGGIITGRVVEKIDPSRKADGTPFNAEVDEPNVPRFVLERTVTTDRTLPDFKAIKFNLERKGKRDGYAPALEIYDGPVNDDDEGGDREQRERELLDQIKTFKEGAAMGAALERERAAAQTAALDGLTAAAVEEGAGDA